jgi:hypothetical protein
MQAHLSHPNIVKFVDRCAPCVGRRAALRCAIVAVVGHAAVSSAGTCSLRRSCMLATSILFCGFRPGGMCRPLSGPRGSRGGRRRRALLPTCRPRVRTAALPAASIDRLTHLYAHMSCYHRRTAVGRPVAAVAGTSVRHTCTQLLLAAAARAHPAPRRASLLTLLHRSGARRVSDVASAVPLRVLSVLRRLDTSRCLLLSMPRLPVPCRVAAACTLAPIAVCAVTLCVRAGWLRSCAGIRRTVAGILAPSPSSRPSPSVPSSLPLRALHDSVVSIVRRIALETPRPCCSTCRLVCLCVCALVHSCLATHARRRRCCDCRAASSRTASCTS